MGTLKRSHTPVPWGAQVEKIVWQKSRVGKPRRRKSDRPSLTHDPGWDWDGAQILFSEATCTPVTEEGCEVPAPLLDDARSSTLPGRTQVTLSLLDVARYQTTTKGRRKSRQDGFEMIRIPRTVPVSEGEPDLWDTWGLGEWEKIDAWGFKRTYSEAVQGFVEGTDHPSTQCYSRALAIPAEDDSWEHL